MSGAELEARLEATVGRGRWFVSAEVPGLMVAGGYQAVETLLSRLHLERRRLDVNDPRRSTSSQFEYMLRPR